MKVKMSSRGKCLCRSFSQMEKCKNYISWNGPYQPKMCTWIDKYNGVVCLYDFEFVDKTTI
jgi:hypothetical protein